MTSFIGRIVPGPEYLLCYAMLSSGNPDFAIKQSNGLWDSEYAGDAGSVYDISTPLQSVVSHSGYHVPTYGAMFYGRVYIDPMTLNIGQLSSELTEDIIIFNGYIDESKIFSGIEFDGADGISLDYGDYDAPPVTLAPLEELHYTLVISMSGPAAISCTISWDFYGTADDAETVITGSRVVVWPLPFKRGVVETMEWLTDVMTGDNGAEQRISLRQHPRQAYRITSNVPRDYRSTMDNLLYGWRDKIWGFPVWTEAAQLTAPADVGSTTLNLDTLYADYSVGGRCLIWSGVDDIFVGTIADIADTWLAIEEPLNKTYPASVWVMPLKNGRLKSDPEQSSKGGKNPEVSATFLLTDFLSVAESTPEVTYNGIDVESMRPLLLGAGTVNDTWEREMTVYDFGPGIRRELSTWDYTRKGRAYTRLLRSREMIWAIRQWLLRRRGKAVPFYQPTYQADLVLVDLAGDVGDVIICNGNTHPMMGVDRGNLAFFMLDGSVELRAVTGAEASEDGTMTLALDSSIDLPRTDVDHISYMGCKRLASDSVDITWQRTDLAELDYSITEIRP